MGTTDPENMSCLRHLQVVERKIDTGKISIDLRSDSHCDLVAGRSVHGPNSETMDLRDGIWKSLFLFTVVKRKGGTITS